LNGSGYELDVPHEKRSVKAQFCRYLGNILRLGVKPGDNHYRVARRDVDEY
jgi:hypothetical protein